MAEQIIYGPLELPSGKVIKFRRPKGMDKVIVTKETRMSADNISNLLLVAQYTAAKCIVEIDGVKPDVDYKRTLEKMDGLDFDYYFSAFDEMFGMTENRRDEAREKARFLLENATSTDLSK